MNFNIKSSEYNLYSSDKKINVDSSPHKTTLNQHGDDLQKLFQSALDSINAHLSGKPSSSLELKAQQSGHKYFFEVLDHENNQVFTSKDKIISTGTDSLYVNQIAKKIIEIFNRTMSSEADEVSEEHEVHEGNSIDAAAYTPSSLADEPIADIEKSDKESGLLSQLSETLIKLEQGKDQPEDLIKMLTSAEPTMAPLISDSLGTYLKGLLNKDSVNNQENLLQKAEIAEKLIAVMNGLNEDNLIKKALSPLYGQLEQNIQNAMSSIQQNRAQENTQELAILTNLYAQIPQASPLDPKNEANEFGEIIKILESKLPDENLKVLFANQLSDLYKAKLGKANDRSLLGQQYGNSLNAHINILNGLDSTKNLKSILVDKISEDSHISVFQGTTGISNLQTVSDQLKLVIPDENQINQSGLNQLVDNMTIEEGGIPGLFNLSSSSNPEESIPLPMIMANYVARQIGNLSEEMKKENLAVLRNVVEKQLAILAIKEKEESLPQQSEAKKFLNNCKEILIEGNENIQEGLKNLLYQKTLEQLTTITKGILEKLEKDTNNTTNTISEKRKKSALDVHVKSLNQALENNKDDLPLLTKNEKLYGSLFELNKSHIIENELWAQIKNIYAPIAPKRSLLNE